MPAMTVIFLEKSGSEWGALVTDFEFEDAFGDVGGVEGGAKEQKHERGGNA